MLATRPTHWHGVDQRVSRCCDLLMLQDENYWWATLAATEPRWQRLAGVCRAAGVEVIYTVIQSLTRSTIRLTVGVRVLDSGFMVRDSISVYRQGQGQGN